MFNKQDKELDRYRNLMKPPEVFEDGFNWRAAAGAIFVGFLMLPASMYLNLFAGGAGGVSTAAQWVTVILFAEIARRSLKELRVQEIYILFFMSGLALSSPFEGLLWRQYLVQADPIVAMGIAQDIPSWYAPSADQIRENGRTFFSTVWLVPILLVSLGLIVGKIDEFGLGYALYRITNDVERLPFPMAPVGAQGITALADSKGTKEAWRWRCFSIGGVIGLAFGAIYIALPAISGAILTKSVALFPIPWVDFTTRTADILPATPVAFAFDLGAFIAGMVLPFWAVIGSVIGILSTIIINPILHGAGILSGWTPQMKLVDTVYSNSIDFYLAFGVGQTIAIVVISMIQIIGPVLLARRLRAQNAADTGASAEQGGLWKRLVTNNTQRGDFSIYVALTIYACTAGFWIVLSSWLVEGFPWQFFAFYAVVYTPLISYACAKLEGIAGQAVSVPYIREATFILSGYQGVAIWFAPAPIPNYGVATVGFRVMELTGTKIISKVKAIIVTMPIIIVASLLFSQLLWSMAEVPSTNYPYAQQYWELQAKQQGVMYTSTTEGGSVFQEAWKWSYFGWGLGVGLVSFGVLSYFGLPTLLVFGIVRGLGQNIPAYALLELMGALIGGFYFRKKFGDQWLSFTPVLAAGFACGMGLISMVSIAVNILIRMMSPLIY
ncbi:MAG TPA: peptide transporter [Planctomycetota bacterium]|nr:peptide transporter [Planctomycetota bacterium]